MFKLSKFPQAKLRTPERPLLLFSEDDIIALYSKETQKHKSHIDEDVKAWLEENRVKHGWTEIVIFGEQLIFNSGLAKPEAEEKPSLLNLIRNTTLNLHHRAS